MSEAKINKVLLWVFVTLLIIAGLLSYFYLVSESVREKVADVDTENLLPTIGSDELPSYTRRTVIEGLSKPWDVAVSEDGQVFFTEKAGAISVISNASRKVLESPNDLKIQGEAGLMGLALDTDFSENRFIYVCFASTADGKPDVRLVRWRVDEDLSGLSDRTDIITGIPYNDTTYPGRHSGCRPRMDGNGHLWVGTGDAAIGETPQDPKSLGGKILRVTRNGDPVVGNAQEPFDPRVYNYGHRNVQGIALGANGVHYSAEHGSNVDDEVNLIVPGNFGWDPAPGYIEAGTPMTDLSKYPNAISALWSSGASTIAVSGLEIIEGEEWGKLNGSLLLAVQKRQHVRALVINEGEVAEEFVFIDDIGRVRSVVQAPNGDIYVATDNGAAQDVIIRLRLNKVENESN